MSFSIIVFLFVANGCLFLKTLYSGKGVCVMMSIEYYAKERERERTKGEKRKRKKGTRKKKEEVSEFPFLVFVTL